MSAKRSRLLLVVLALAGGACWSDRPAATPAPPRPAGSADPTAGGPPSSGIRFVPRSTNRCARAIAHILEQSKADIASSSFPETFIQELQDAAVASCQETGWSSESLDCFERTDSSSEITTCFKAMDTEQQEDFQKRITELFKRQSASAQPPPP
jgi:hypothetical protein